MRYLPGRSLRGTFGIRVDCEFTNWAGVANVFDLRFNAIGAEELLNSLAYSAKNDNDSGVRYVCVHVLRALKDVRSVSELRNIATLFAQATDDEGEEARDAISEIEGATVTVTLPKTTSETYKKLALELK